MTNSLRQAAAWRRRSVRRAVAIASVLALAACARGGQEPARVEAPGAARPGAARPAPAPGPSARGLLDPGPDRQASSPYTADPAPRIAPLPHGEGARRMGARLDGIIRALEPRQNIFLNAGRVERLKIELATDLDPPQRVFGLSYLADEQLKSGQVAEAIATTTRMLDPPPELKPVAPPDSVTREFLALCDLRLGETQNCIATHASESCLIPIRGSGVHGRQEGSRAAIAQYLKILAADPQALGARWLLNIAAMTLGEYPDKVPPQWRLPADFFRPEADIGRFTDVAAKAGLIVVGHAGGAVVDDFDGDGNLDLFVSSMGVYDQLRFFHNAGDGTFKDRTRAAGLTGLTGGLNIVHADYNNDGHPDLLVLRGGWMNKGGRFPNSLLRNNGDGTFDDVTEEAGILTLHPTQTGAWADYDGDGWLDLVVGNESTPGDPHTSELWHNERDGTFRETTADIGPADFGYVKGVVWGDYNNDGRPDLYVSVLGEAPNRLFRNDGPRPSPGPHGEDWIFTEVGREAGVQGPKDSFPAWWWDFDNDGWLDLMAAGFRFVDINDLAAFEMGLPSQTELPRLYHNNHDGTFTDVAHAMRIDRVALPMGSNFGDFDNDGWQDCWFGTGEPSFRSLIPNRFFRLADGKVFQEITYSAGVGNIQKGHGVAPADIDNDGDLDAFVEMGGWYEADIAHSNLFRNPGNHNHWVTLRVEGRKSNRSAIGARVRVRVRTPAGPRDITATVASGGSFGGGSLQRQIGLGQAGAIELIEVRWPTTGAVQTFKDVPMDRFYRVVEGDDRITPLSLKRIPL
ncbi:MAG TPA: CRTAC1 family protein [Patescibacteria group bacterium]|nr:CRTAC1 family protein [Patescibacteria group bacterium]